MLVRMFNRTIIRNDPGRRFLSDIRNPGNIVRSISHECLDIDKFLRCDQIPFFHIRRIIIFNLGSCTFCLGNPDFHMVSGKLKEIPVTGKNHDFHSLCFASSGKRSQKIIRLQSRLLNGSNAHRMKDFLHKRHLLP